MIGLGCSMANLVFENRKPLLALSFPYEETAPREQAREGTSNLPLTLNNTRGAKISLGSPGRVRQREHRDSRERCEKLLVHYRRSLAIQQVPPAVACSTNNGVQLPTRQAPAHVKQVPLICCTRGGDGGATVLRRRARAGRATTPARFPHRLKQTDVVAKKKKKFQTAKRSTTRRLARRNARSNVANIHIVDKDPSAIRDSQERGGSPGTWTRMREGEKVIEQPACRSPALSFPVPALTTRSACDRQPTYSNPQTLSLRHRMRKSGVVGREPAVIESKRDGTRASGDSGSNGNAG